jgi:hypothetical protein
MDTTLLIAAGLAILVGIAHSVLGERYILTRLFRRSEIPPLFGSDLFTRRTLRFAWHITSIAWCGFAALLWVLAAGDTDDLYSQSLKVVAATFGASAALTLGASRGRHLAWVVFAAIAALSWMAS